jgi:hypothetical protein
VASARAASAFRLAFPRLTWSQISFPTPTRGQSADQPHLASCHPPTRDAASWLRARFTPLARRLDHVADRYGHTARRFVPFLKKRVSVSPASSGDYAVGSCCESKPRCPFGCSASITRGGSTEAPTRTYRARTVTS